MNECLAKDHIEARIGKQLEIIFLQNKLKLNKHQVPQDWSIEAADFINRLIQRKPSHRLGLNGPEEVKSHVWFKNYNWKSIKSK